MSIPTLVTNSQNRVFHTLSADTSFDTIREQGLKGNHNIRLREREEKTLDTVATHYDIQHPATRREAVYCWPRAQPVNTMAPSDEDDMGGLMSDYSGVIVDISTLDNTMCVAEMHHMSTLITELHRTDTTLPDTFPDNPESSSVVQAARSYLESITPATTWSEITTASKNYECPELIINGDVPPHAIVDTFTK